MDNKFAIRLIVAGIDSGYIVLYPGETLEIIPDGCFIGLNTIPNLEERHGVATDGLAIKAYKDLDDLISEPVNVVCNDPVVQQGPEVEREKEKKKEKKEKKKRKYQRKKENKENKETKERERETERRKGTKYTSLPLEYSSITLEEMRTRDDLMKPYLLANPHRSIGEAFNEFDDFRNYHEKHGTVYASWLAAWRTWIKKSIEFAKKNALQNGGRAPLNFVTAPQEWV